MGGPPASDILFGFIDCRFGLCPCCCVDPPRMDCFLIADDGTGMDDWFIGWG